MSLKIVESRVSFSYSRLPSFSSKCTHYQAKQEAITGSVLQYQIAVSLQLGCKFKLEPDNFLHYSFS